MTNKEALEAALQVQVSTNTLEKALIDADLTGSADYTKTNATTIDQCAIGVLEGLLSTPDVSEGGFSFKYDRKAIQARIEALYNKLGLSDSSGPSVKGVSVW